MKYNLRRVLVIIFIIFIGFYLVFAFKNSHKLVNNPAFPKGLLAINTDKSTYLLGETVKIQIASLDLTGHTVCNSDLILEIQGKKETDIHRSSTCGDDNVTNNPDYFFDYKTDEAGTYTLKLTNQTTGLVVRKEFIVVKNRDLDIVRETATRISSSKADRYPVKFIVTANKAYQGSVSDVIPKGFTIPWQGPGQLEGQKITWQLNLKAGETKELIYEYSPPKNNSNLFKFGRDGEWQVITTI